MIELFHCEKDCLGLRTCEGIKTAGRGGRFYQSSVFAGRVTGATHNWTRETICCHLLRALSTVNRQLATLFEVAA